MIFFVPRTKLSVSDPTTQRGKFAVSTVVLFSQLTSLLHPVLSFALCSQVVLMLASDLDCDDVQDKEILEEFIHRCISEVRISVLIKIGILDKYKSLFRLSA